MTKRIVVAVLAVLTMSFAISGCNQKDDDTSEIQSVELMENTDVSVNQYTIGICQFTQKDSLDYATNGFKDTLIEKLGEENVTFDEQNAQGDSQNCVTICTQFVDSNVDLILGNGIDALQSAYKATNSIPILGTSINDYSTALDIDDWKGYTETNVSGTSDIVPLDQQATIMKELFPNKETIGVLYCSAEANSKYQYETIKPYFEQDGYTVKEYTFSDSEDIADVTTTACEECDVLYIPADNTVEANTGIIDNIAQPNAIPIIAGEEGICGGCGVATISIDYYELGKETGEMAYEILEEGKDISTMEIRYAPTIKKYSKSRCEALGIEVPDDYEPIEKE